MSLIAELSEVLKIDHLINDMSILTIKVPKHQLYKEAILFIEQQFPID